MNDKIYPQPPGVCYCMNIRRASRVVTQFYDDVLKPSGLTVARLSLLRHFEMLKPTTMNELAKRMRIDRTTLNRNMKPLLETGFIVVNPGKDSRTREIMLTKAGKDAADKGWSLNGGMTASPKSGQYFET